MKQYLLEIGLEEVPARFLMEIAKQLQERVEDFLTDRRINFESSKSYSTPRRLAVLVEGIDSHQADLTEKMRGPSLKVAQTEDGDWSPAATGFARGQGASVEDIVVEDYNGEDYIFIQKHVEGQPVEEILKEMGTVIDSMTFPISMSWGSQEKSFIRPIHWLVSLLDDKVVPFSYLGIDASNKTWGHRFLGGEVTLDHAGDYVERLKRNFVYVDPAQRAEVIREQIQEIAQENHWHVPINEELLAEVRDLVEWPTAFAGDFEEEYLEVPAIILITAMEDHQRYFHVLDENDQLAPHFISIRNGNRHALENVIQGNEKVLRARLEDALFFYREDLDKPLEHYLERLSAVQEHYELGTLADKQVRVKRLLDSLVANIQGKDIPSEELRIAKEAAEIYKFALMTLTVGEFTELQGPLGEIYAQKFDLEASVARAIGTQYLPNTTGGKLPDTLAGALLAFVDRVDTLVQYFNVGIIPTGSADPFALRRQAMGIVEIAHHEEWSIYLEDLFATLAKDSETLEKLLAFMNARIQQYLDVAGIDHKIGQSVLKSNHVNPYQNIQTAHFLQSLKDHHGEEYSAMVEGLTRVVNLGVDVEDVIDLSQVDAQTDSEAALVTAIRALDNHKVLSEQLTDYIALVPKITKYFEENMVNDDQPAIRTQRVSTMATLTQAILQVFDPRELSARI